MNLGFPEMAFIFLLALLLFGPKRLPEIGRQIGKALAEFKRASNDFKAQLETEIRQIDIEEALRKEKEALTNAILPPEGTVPSTPATSYTAPPDPVPYTDSPEANALAVPPPSEASAAPSSKGPDA